MLLTFTLRALSDPTRRKILELLKKRDMPVSQIAKHFDMKLPSVSHHLNMLKQANLVTFQRQGQELIYSLNISVFEEITNYLIKFFKK